MEETIFDSGYLVETCLNPDYVSLAGWPVEFYNHPNRKFPAELTAIANGKMLIKFGRTSMLVCSEQIAIPTFCPGDIPVGELCWFSDGGGDWYLLRYGGLVEQPTGKNSKGVFYFPIDDDELLAMYCVPLLMAGNPARANELKEWEYEIY